MRAGVRFARKTAVIVIVLTILGLCSIPWQSLEGAQTRKYIDLKIVEKFKIKNNSEVPFPLEDFVNASLYHNSTDQLSILVSLQVNGSEVGRSEVKYDEDGNPYVEIDLPKDELLPGDSLEFYSVFKVRVYERKIPGPPLAVENSGILDDIPADIREKYTAKSRMFQTDNEALRKLVNELKGDDTNVLSIVLRMINWTEYHVKYPSETVFGKLKPPSYPNETYARGVGDCDDQANLVVTMLRIAGIPAMTQGGIIFEPLLTRAQENRLVYGNGSFTFVAKRVGGHGWVMAYVPPWGWLAIDLTYFENMTMAPGGYIRSEDLLDHIEGAALYKKFVIVSFNVSSTDYVAATREWLEKMDKYSLEIYDYLEISVEPLETTKTEQEIISAETTPTSPLPTETATPVAQMTETSTTKATTKTAVTTVSTSQEAVETSTTEMLTTPIASEIAGKVERGGENWTLIPTVAIIVLLSVVVGLLIVRRKRS